MKHNFYNIVTTNFAYIYCSNMIQKAVELLTKKADISMLSPNANWAR